MEFDYVVVYMYRDSIQVHGIYSEYEDALRAEETLKSCARMSVAYSYIKVVIVPK